MTISVVILSYRAGDLSDLLECLCQQTYKPTEVVLIDVTLDAALEGMALTALQPSGVDLVYRHYPAAGTVRGRNLGVQLARGDLIVLLDDDMLVASDYLETAHAFFCEQRHADVAAITLLGPFPGIAAAPAQQSARSRIRHAVKCMFLLDSRKPGVVLPTGFRSELPDATAPVEWVQGCNSIWRSDVLKRFGFDERMERYPYALSEDVALSARVSREYRLFAVHGSGCYHKKSPGTRLNPRQFGESLVRNHRHIAVGMQPTGQVPLAFHWATAGLLLQGIAGCLVRPSRDSLGYLRGVIAGLRGWVPDEPESGSRPVRSPEVSR